MSLSMILSPNFESDLGGQRVNEKQLHLPDGRLLLFRE
jgi:hypothetical protein